MSKCLPCEQAKLALQKVSNIVNGYVNLITNANEELAKQRKDICLGCNDKKPLVIINKIQYYTCRFCHCPIDAKVTVNEEFCSHPNNKKW